MKCETMIAPRISEDAHEVLKIIRQFPDKTGKVYTNQGEFISDLLALDEDALEVLRRIHAL